MKEFDFLPQSFHQAVRLSRQRQTNILYSVGLAVVFATFYFSNQSRLKSAEACLTDLQRETSKADLQNAQLETLHIQKQTLNNNVELINHLEDDAPMDAIIGEITRLMSDPMALISLKLETKTHKPSEDKKVDPLLCPRTTWVKLVGVAENDVKVGIFFGQLSACPLFDDASMSFTRDFDEGGRQMREFEFTFRVNPVASDQLDKDSNEVG